MANLFFYIKKTPLLRGENKYVFFIFVFALALRLGYTLLIQQNYPFYNQPSSDVRYYQDWAQDILTQGPRAKEAFSGMPLYPHLLAAIKLLSCGYPEGVRFFHLILGACNCSLLYILSRKFLSKRTSFTGAILMASHFPLIYYDWLMMPPPVIIFLSLLMLISLLEAQYSKDYFFLGLLLGLAILADGKFVIFALLLVPFQYRHRQRTSQIHILMLGLGLGSILFFSAGHNYLTSGGKSILSYHSGINFYIGNNARASGTFQNPEFLRPSHDGHVNDAVLLAQKMSGRRLSLSEANTFWIKKAADFIKNNPLPYAKLLARKFLSFFREDEAAFDLDLLLQRKWKATWDFNPLQLMWPLAILGLVLTLRRSGTMGLNFLLISQLIFTLIFFLVNRHRVTILPILILYEAAALTWLIQKIYEKKSISVFVSFLGLIFGMMILTPRTVNPATIDFLKFTKTGYSHLQKGDPISAEQYFLKALQLRPHDTNALYNLGNVYLLSERPEAAVTVLEQARAIHPLNPDVLYNLAGAYRQSGRTTEAQILYQEVLTLTPQSIDAHWQLAEMLVKSADCSSARPHLEFIKGKAPALRPVVEELSALCAPSL